MKEKREEGRGLCARKGFDICGAWGVLLILLLHVASAVRCQGHSRVRRRRDFRAHHDAEDEVGLAQAQLSTLSPIGAWTVSGVGGV